MAKRTPRKPKRSKSKKIRRTKSSRKIVKSHSKRRTKSKRLRSTGRKSDKALARSRSKQKKSRRRGKTLRGGVSTPARGSRSSSRAKTPPISSARMPSIAERSSAIRKRQRDAAAAAQAAADEEARRARVRQHLAEVRRRRVARAASPSRRHNPAEERERDELLRAAALRERERIEELLSPTGHVERFAREVFRAPAADARERVIAARRRVTAAGDKAKRQIAAALARILAQTGSLAPDAWVMTAQGLELAREAAMRASRSASSLAADTLRSAEEGRQEWLEAARRAAQSAHADPAPAPDPRGAALAPVLPRGADEEPEPMEPTEGAFQWVNSPDAERWQAAMQLPRADPAPAPLPRGD